MYAKLQIFKFIWLDDMEFTTAVQLWFCLLDFCFLSASDYLMYSVLLDPVRYISPNSSICKMFIYICYVWALWAKSARLHATQYSRAVALQVRLLE